MPDLIVYFSRKDENYVGGIIKNLEQGNTARVADSIQKLTGGTVSEITMATPYSKKYNTCIEEALADQKRDARPELEHLPESIEAFDTIYLGYPNYWGTMPMAVFTFLDHFDFSGKTIKPFCTHEGSGLGNSVRDLKRQCKTATVEPGLAVHGSRIDASKTAIQNWVRGKNQNLERIQK